MDMRILGVYALFIGFRSLNTLQESPTQTRISVDPNKPHPARNPGNLARILAKSLKVVVAAESILPTLKICHRWMMLAKMISP